MLNLREAAKKRRNKIEHLIENGGKERWRVFLSA